MNMSAPTAASRQVKRPRMNFQCQCDCSERSPRIQDRSVGPMKCELCGEPFRKKPDGTDNDSIAMTYPPCKSCNGTGHGPALGTDLKALRVAAKASITATARAMEVSRTWVAKVESGKDPAPEEFVTYYVQHFETDRMRVDDARGTPKG